MREACLCFSLTSSEECSCKTGCANSKDEKLSLRTCLEWFDSAESKNALALSK